MGEWWTYRPSDFLMFSPRIYWRLFAALNQQWWPAQPLLLGAALAWLGWAARHAGSAAARVALLGAGLCWPLVAWAFFLERYAPINWAAPAAALAFALQGAALLTLAAGRGVGLRADRAARAAGNALLLWALLGQPLLAWAAGRDWRQAEVFGLAPDPTAIGTLGLLLRLQVGAGVARWLARAAWAVPLLWCLASAATLWTMGSAQGWVPTAAAALALVAAACRRS